MTSCLKTKLRDVHYNQCFEKRADHVFVLPTGLPILSYIGLYRLIYFKTNKISFVETGKNAKNSIWCARKQISCPREKNQISLSSVQPNTENKKKKSVD